MSKESNQVIVDALKARLVSHNAMVIMEENPVKLGSVAMLLPRVFTLPLPIYLCDTQEKLNDLKSMLEANGLKPFYIFGGHAGNEFKQHKLQQIAKTLCITNDSFFLSEYQITGFFYVH